MHWTLRAGSAEGGPQEWSPELPAGLERVLRQDLQEAWPPRRWGRLWGWGQVRVGPGEVLCSLWESWGGPALLVSCAQDLTLAPASCHPTPGGGRVVVHTHPGWGDGGRGLTEGRGVVGFRAQRTPGQIQVQGAGLFRQEVQAGSRFILYNSQAVEKQFVLKWLVILSPSNNNALAGNGPRCKQEFLKGPASRG